jgi:hypothetical protein
MSYWNLKASEVGANPVAPIQRQRPTWTEPLSELRPDDCPRPPLPPPPLLPPERPEEPLLDWLGEGALTAGLEPSTLGAGAAGAEYEGRAE